MQINNFELNMVQNNDHSFVKIKPDSLDCLKEAVHNEQPLEKTDDEELCHFDNIFYTEDLTPLSEVNMTKGLLEQLLYDLLFAVESSEHYLLDANRLMLQPDHIYYDNNEHHFLYCYFPINPVDKINSVHPIVNYYDHYIETRPINQMSSFKLYLLKQYILLNLTTDGNLYIQKLSSFDPSNTDSIKSFICILDDNVNNTQANNKKKTKKHQKYEQKKRFLIKNMVLCL